MKVGRFRLHAALAAGAAGTVWRARHVSGHPAAVKLLRRVDHAERFELELDADDEQLQLAGELLELEPSLLRVVAERTGGNPLYLLQLIAQGVADDVLEPGPWGHRLHRGAQLGLPEDLRTSCASLADSLPSSWRDPLLLAALLGPDVDDRTWTRMDHTPCSSRS